ncbi:MAG: cytochrome c [Ignavibacteriae bacterium]|jgi:mono/diheme cytochrome c family protein|nr:cytochrome c [Ignavibacteriota bacterium]NOG98108.1 cytochrome c [Ignavibacteriota bacterium]
MTNAQKWVAVFLGLFVVLFIIGKATKEEESFGDSDYYGSTEGAAEVSGLELIESVGCIRCHGIDLQGTALAPGLYEAKNHWSRKDLINYLRNPSAYDGDERFDKYRDKYSGSIMPSYGNRDVKELGKIADYLLSLDK